MFVHDLLEVRDAGESITGPERALLLAGLVTPPADPQQLEPLGRTTAKLLRLHEHLAGPLLEGTVPCPACAATVEFGLETRALLALESGIVDEPAPLLVEGEQVAWRPVAYADLVTAFAEEPERVDDKVLSRCVDEPGRRLAPQTRAEVVAAMAEADPLAEISMDLACPECGGQVLASLDVVRFAWAEVEARAGTLMAEVDALARAYSWSEAAILAMPARRRERFVALVTGEA